MFLMIDNYDSFTYNLYALFRKCGADVKVIKNREYIDADEFDGIILSPGPSTPENSGTTLEYLKRYLGKKPIFGVCLGMQSIAHAMGFKIKQAESIKHGKIDNVAVIKKSVLFRNLPDEFKVVRYHSLAVDVDEGMVTSRSKSDGVIMSIEDTEKKIFGVQFHPESISSQFGSEIVTNFLNYVYKRTINMDQLLIKINSGDKLDFDESIDFFENMVNGSLTEAQVGASLVSMKLRGETSEELAGLVSVLDRHKKRFHHCAGMSIDTCGTGGDGKSTVNISTAVSIIMASMGYNVVKHGNTAQSGKVGSADILAEMGMDINNDKTSAEDFFRDNNFIFLFAQKYHPALKGIGKVRRELKVPTIFNFVGPLVNPANPDFQMIGISRRERLTFIAEAIKRMGKNNITVYSSYDGYDEVSSKDKTECISIKNGKLDSFIIDPSIFFEPFDMPHVKAREEALEYFMKGVSGEDENLANLFSLNAALALKTIDGTDLNKGFITVKEHIKSGKVKEKINRMLG